MINCSRSSTRGPRTTVTLRVDTGAPPLRLLKDAEDAALSGGST